MLTLRFCCSALAVLLLPLGALAADAPAPSDGPTFERDIRPILKAHCFRCHGGEEETKGGLDLRLRRSMAAGGDSGPAIVPGKRAESLLYERVKSGEMPPVDKKLSPAEVDVIGRWIDAGARTAREEPEQLEAGPGDHARGTGLLVVPADSATSADSRLHLDRSGAHADRCLPGAGPARARAGVFARRDQAVLLARAYFDLVGLPPTREELAHFLADNDPQAYEKAIDRLLESPHYGERWGATGWTWPATPTPTATRRPTHRGRSPTSFATT